MLEIVHGYERSERPELFNSMFRHRKSVFIDQKQWELQPTEEELEIDEFDRDDAVYICSLLARRLPRWLSQNAQHDDRSYGRQRFQDMFPGLTVRSPTIWGRHPFRRAIRSSPSAKRRIARSVRSASWNLPFWT